MIEGETWTRSRRVLEGVGGAVAVVQLPLAAWYANEHQTSVLTTMSFSTTATLVTLVVAKSLVGALAPRRRKAVRCEGPDPRTGPSAGPQLTSRRCAECNDKILFETSARACRECGAPLHKKTCAKRHRALAHPLSRATPYR